MNKIKKIGEMNQIYIKKNKNDKYYYFLIKENWNKLVGEIVAENSFPSFFNNGKLYVNVKDSTILQQLSMYKNEIIDIFEKDLGERVVTDIDIKKDKNNQKNNKIIYSKKNEQKEIIKKYSEISVNIENIKLEKEEEKLIEISLEKVDNKYFDIKKRIKKIAINKLKEEKVLKEQGLINCTICGELFLPQSDEKICIKCINKKEEEKMNEILKKIKNNPLLELEKDMDIKLFLRARDIIAQDYFYDMIEIIKEHKQLTVSEEKLEDYKKNDKIKEFNEYMRQYIEYKTGSNDTSVQESLKKETIYKMKKIIEIKYKK